MGLQDFILDQAINHAQSNHQSSNDDSNVYSSAASFLKDRFNNKQDDDHDDLDEDDMIGAHKSLYGGGDGSYGREHDSGSLGKGAAVEALKQFTSGGGSGSGSSEGGMDKNALIGIAMAQAGKLWEEKQSSGSGDVSGDKQSAVNSAAEMALKMYMKSNGSGEHGTGGPSGLLGLASKFM